MTGMRVGLLGLMVDGDTDVGAALGETEGVRVTGFSVVGCVVGEVVGTDDVGDVVSGEDVEGTAVVGLQEEGDSEGIAEVGQLVLGDKDGAKLVGAKVSVGVSGQEGNAGPRSIQERLFPISFGSSPRLLLSSTPNWPTLF